MNSSMSFVGGEPRHSRRSPSICRMLLVTTDFHSPSALVERELWHGHAHDNAGHPAERVRALILPPHCQALSELCLIFDLQELRVDCALLRHDGSGLVCYGVQESVSGVRLFREFYSERICEVCVGV